MLLWILASTFLVSAISLLGVLTLVVTKRQLNRLLPLLVALSAGVLIGSAFLHLIPEAAEAMAIRDVFLFVIAGFVVFFFVEKLLFWRHCHAAECHVHSFAYMNLVGDGVHNFIDGLILAASFLTNFELGVTTTLAVALHEVPQELSDFGVLVYAGFKKTKALAMNLACALIAVLGGLCGYFLSSQAAGLASLLVPFAAGGFVYISASDLVPELKQEKRLSVSLLSFVVFLAGVAFIWAL